MEVQLVCVLILLVLNLWFRLEYVVDGYVWVSMFREFVRSRYVYGLAASAWRNLYCGAAWVFWILGTIYMLQV